jgi:flagellar M-ring protein FliF
VAGGIKRLSAAVTVAQQVKVTGTTRELIKRDPAELKKIEGLARNVLGIDATRGDEITVEEMPFNDQFATEPRTWRRRSGATSGGRWGGTWPTPRWP